jgi:hypothetical protein
MHKEELHNLYSSPNAIRVITEQEMDGTCCMNVRNVYKIVAGNPEVKTQICTHNELFPGRWIRRGGSEHCRPRYSSLIMSDIES